MGATRIKSKSHGITQFINLHLTSDQTNINADTEVAFILESSNGLSVTSNRVTLKDNITYILITALRHAGSQASTSGRYIWRDYTNGVNLGIGLLVNSQNDTTNDGVQPIATTIIKPSTDIDVGVRCTFVNVTNQSLASDSTQASIHSIPEF